MTPTTAVPTVVTRSTSRRWPLIGAGVIVLATLLGAGYWRLGRRPPTDQQRVFAPTFVNKTGDVTFDPVVAYATAAVSSGLAEIEGIEIVESFGNRATAGTLVAGTLYREGDSLLLSATLSDGVSGKSFYTVGPVLAPVTRPRDAIEPLAQRVVGGVAVLIEPTLGPQGVLPSRPPRWDAFQEFNQGDLSFYAEGEDSAFAHFARAAALDPAFTLARLRAAMVLVNAGTKQWARADSAVSAAVGDRARLSPYERAYLDWIRAWHNRDWEGTHRASVALTEAAPRSEIAAYIRGNFASLSMHWREAATVLGQLDPVSPTLRIRSAYYAHLTNAHHMLGEHERELEVARKARARFPDQLRIRQLEVRALAALGDGAELGLRLSDALAQPAQAERMGSAGRVLLTAATEARVHRHPTIADAALSQLRDWVETRLSAGDTATSTQRLRIDALRLGGAPDQARVVAESLLALNPSDAASLGVLGILAAQDGRRADAERYSGSLAAIRRPDLFGEPTLWRARIAAQLGDKPQAVALLRAAMVQGSRPMAMDDADPDLEPLRDYPPFRELARARD
jgi:tetratricopeptide (TPR) repeat protein